MLLATRGVAGVDPVGLPRAELAGGVQVGGRTVDGRVVVLLTVLDAEGQLVLEVDGVGDVQAERAVALDLAVTGVDLVAGVAVERGGVRALVEVPAGLVVVLGAGPVDRRGALAVDVHALVTLEIAAGVPVRLQAFHRLRDADELAAAGGVGDRPVAAHHRLGAVRDSGEVAALAGDEIDSSLVVARRGNLGLSSRLVLRGVDQGDGRAGEVRHRPPGGVPAVRVHCEEE